MKVTLLFLLFVMLFSTCVVNAQIDNEANFYTAGTNANFNRNLVTHYGADNNFATDDSSTLRTAINDIASNGGGTLFIPAGNYSFANIYLQSNVHIEIDENAVIRPTDQADQKNYFIFSFGSDNSILENVSISGYNGKRFLVDLRYTNNPNVTVIGCGAVKNFLIAHMDIEDAQTKFSKIGMGGTFINNVYVYPTNGIVKDVNVNNAHYGYGTVQTQSAEHVLFKDLSGKGGATLRLETGFVGLNNLQGDNLPPGETKVGGLDNIVGRNISCDTGNCAVMVSPHAVHNGTVDIDGVVSVNSGFGVRIEGGFVNKNKYDMTINLTRGTFKYVKVRNVTATYGDTAELKSKHFNYYPEEISKPTTKSTYSNLIFIGPSIAPVLADGNYICTNGVKTVDVDEDTVTSIGFLYQGKIVPADYETETCEDSLSVKKKRQK